MLEIFIKKNKELDALAYRVDTQAENNYKDNAQAAFRDLEKRFNELKESGKIKGKSIEYYEMVVGKRREMMKDFHH